MSESKAKPRLPPRWFIRLFWFTHRRLYRLTRGHLGLWRPKPNGWGRCISPLSGGEPASSAA